MLYMSLIILQVVVAIAVIVLVLLQHGKGADAGAAFGSGASGTVFGARGSASFLSRTTGLLATIFFVNCLCLAYLSAHQVAGGASVVDQSNIPGLIKGSVKGPAKSAAPMSSEGAVGKSK